MPLLDHFRPPLQSRHHWGSFHSNWTTRLADGLSAVLPAEFLAEEHTHGGPGLEINVATDEQAAVRSLKTVFPDTFAVRVFTTTGGLTLVGAIELISPGNKDRAEERRAFAIKCASYLHQGVSLVIIDIVTNRRANLHNETMRLMNAPADMDLPDEVHLYAVAYRPVLRKEQPEIDLWTAPVAVGQPLPVLPLRLTGDLFVPVDFESAYVEACRRRRLA
jgi:hypothetical protein